MAIGTSALAGAGNAFANLGQHARRGNVKWRCAAVFAACGVAGAAIGAHIGKAVDGRALILAFAAIMVIVGLAMLRPKAAGGDPRSEEHTSELQSLMRISYAVFCLKKKKKTYTQHTTCSK